MATRFNILDDLRKIQDESDREEWELWGGVGPGDTQSTDLFNSPKFKEIVDILLKSPILVAPTLNWLKQKQAQIARAQLESLYTPEELEEMYKKINNTT